MRRFVTLVFLLLFTVPFGISISGCGKKIPVVYCSGGSSGPVVGQLSTITLQPRLTGLSLNAGQFGQVQTPTAVDCKGTGVSVSSFTYAAQDGNGKSDLTLVDVVPSTGRLCAGTWNRNTGGGIPDYTVCNVTGRTGTGYIVASASGATSNPLAVFVHPVVTGIVLGAPSTNCATDLATNCCPLATTGAPVTAPPYNPNSCLSQGQTGQLAARVYAGAGSAQTNISCTVTAAANGTPTYTPQVGFLSFTPQTSAVVTIDQNGVATANQPGSTLVTAAVSNAGSSGAGSSAGYFSTCPPTSITLSVPNSSSTSITLNQNNTQPLTAVVKDKNNVTLTGLALQLVSTTPTTLPGGGSGTVTPTFPGGGAVTAVCAPPGCNPAPLNELGILGNGQPLTSNPIQITTPGISTTVLYAASTGSQYITSVDFTTNVVGSPLRLPFVPNSMVISNDGSTIYLGSATELMVYNALGNAVGGQFPTIPGKVLAVSPDNNTVVVADTARAQVYLATPTGTITTQYGGIATRAAFSPDSSTVYITAGNQVLVYSTFTGWIALNSTTNDVAVTVPSVGAYFAGPVTTARSYCANTTVTSNNTSLNEFYPLADTVGLSTDRISATNDGRHIVGASASTAQIVDLGIALPTGACPMPPQLVTPTYFTRTSSQTIPLTGITPSTITGVLPASDSSFVAVTYTGTGGAVPFYSPGAPGSVGNVALSGGATAPVSGTFSSDNQTFFAGTTGDNRVHLLTRTANSFVDSSTLDPKLTSTSGTGFAAPDLLVQRPRRQL